MSIPRPRPTVLTLTDAAAQRVKAIMASKGPSVAGLKIGVKKGGCAGMEYTMEWAEAAGKYAAGSTHTAKITRVAEFGAFAELEPGIEGPIHISELANERVRRTEDVVRLGQEVQARVLQVEPAKRRIRLSIRKRDEKAEAAAAAEMAARQAHQKQRQKRLEKKPLRGGLEW